MIRTVHCLTIAACLFASGQVSAQNESAVIQAVSVHVAPGKNAQFEEYIRGLISASEELGMEHYWLVAQSVSGPPKYEIQLQHASWDLLGVPSILVRLEEAVGEREAERLMGLAADSIESVDTAFYTPAPEISVARAESDTAPVAVVIYNLTIAPNMMQQYIDVSAATREAFLANAPGSSYYVSLPGFGATGVRVVGIVESWGDLGAGGTPGGLAIQHYGPTLGGGLTTLANQAISSQEAVLHRTRPDLSYEPE